MESKAFFMGKYGKNKADIVDRKKKILFFGNTIIKSLSLIRLVGLQQFNNQLPTRCCSNYIYARFNKENY